MLYQPVLQAAPEADQTPMEYHKIFKDDHDDMIKAYFKGKIPAPDCRSAAQMKHFVGEPTDTSDIELDIVPGADPDDNSDIKLSTHAATEITGHIDYHADLIRELLGPPHSATKFCFSKAIKNGGVDVVFKALLGNGNYYYADLSHI